MTNEQAIKWLKALKNTEILSASKESLDLAIKALEARPQGEWINQFIGGNECVMCSECKLHFDIGTNYCPNCGADMRGDNNG